MQYLKYTAISLFFLGASAFAAPVSWDGNFGTQILQPLQSFWGAQIKGSYFTATSTTAASTFPFASTTALSATSLCLTADCRTAWPDTSGFVPYTGATQEVDLGAQNLTTSGILFSSELSNQSATVVDVTNHALVDASDTNALDFSDYQALQLLGYPTNGFVKTSNSDGTLTIDTSTYSTAGYPFPDTGNATSTLTQFNGGLTAYASSTIGDGTTIGGLTINGRATTTSLVIPSLTSALIATDAVGLAAEYAGTTCPGSNVGFSISALGVITCTKIDNNFWSGANDLQVNNGGTGNSSLTSNRVLTGDGTSPIVDEANLTFDGTLLTVTGNVDITGGATTTNATTTNLSISGQLDVDTLTSALVLTGAGGVFAEYAGTSCTNQFPRSLSALGAATCATVANTDLANSTVSYGGVTLSLGGTDATPAFNLADATGLPVAGGGTGAASFTDGGVLLGGGTGAITAMAALANGSIIVGDGTTDPVALAAFESSTGDLAVTAGGTGVSTLTGIALGNGTSDFTAITTSAGIFGAISDETGGTGVLVGSASPDLTGELNITNSGNTNSLDIDNTNASQTNNIVDVSSVDEAGFNFMRFQYDTDGTPTNAFVVGVTGNTTINGTLTLNGIAAATTDRATVCVVVGGGLTTSDAAGNDCDTSSKRFKHDIEYLDINGLEILNTFKPASFTRNRENAVTEWGFIAEDMAESAKPLALYEEDKTTPYSISKYGIMAVITKAVQELSEWNTKQDDRLGTIEARLDALENENKVLRAITNKEMCYVQS